ncbi:MAG: hypothetical protein JW751_22645 [Polyangiaceae bacterium]|nr:hypothetical protein [Polyangiaceae bacterium]
MTSAEATRVHALLVEDRAALIVEQPFLALLALHLDLTVTTDLQIPSFAVDGVRIHFDPRFVRRATATERRFALAHAVWHCALLHPWRRGERDPVLWDLAVDHEVNALLATDRHLPSAAFLLDQSASADADALYEHLRADPSLCGPNATAPQRGPLADQHLNPTRTVGLRADLGRCWAEHLVQAATQTTRRGLTLAPRVWELVERVRRPVVSWREALRQYVVSVAGDRRVWLPPNRRHLGRGEYLPSRREELLRIVVGVDSSASTVPVAATFVAEVAAVARAFPRRQLTLIEADHAVRRVAHFDTDSPPPDAAFVWRGGGGTDLSLVFDETARRGLFPNVLVFLTDGQGKAPPKAPPYPVVWAIPRGYPAPAGWGHHLTLPTKSCDGGYCLEA